MSAPWLDIPWTVLDFESTGIDLENDRAVQVAVVQLDLTRPGVKKSLCQIIDPGIPIPDAAQKVHGITDERARAEGLNPAVVIPQVAQIVESTWRDGTPVIAMSASFDLTLLDRELRRHAGRELNLAGALVLDPLVIDRACDPYRAGSRKLDALAAHYRVRQEGAHDALADCLTAARVVWRQARIADTRAGASERGRNVDYSPLRELSLPELHRWQVDRYREWAESYERYLRDERGRKNATVDGSWPWRPLVGVGVTA